MNTPLTKTQELKAQATRLETFANRKPSRVTALCQDKAAQLRQEAERVAKIQWVPGFGWSAKF